MKIKVLPYITLFLLSIFTLSAFSQEKEIKRPELKEKKTKILKRLRTYKKIEKVKPKKFKPNAVEVKIDKDFYSVFTDFRIPVREEVNESDLLDEGWITEEARYAFRCKKEERVRLTFWTLKKEGNKYDGSEFINVTHESDFCNENDIAYSHKAPKLRAKKSYSKKGKSNETNVVEEDTPKESIVTKFKKETKKKKKKKWKGVKK